MQLQDAIKAKICINRLTANYPLGDFVQWVEREQISLPLLMVLLERIQKELDAEVTACGQLMNHYWCLYCGQVRAYYQAIIREPGREQTLSFLLKE
ncbi:hypothetical protein [Cellvibrio sp. PSBB006]|uniref:hypothetical protein n=1 Tax=Cellvibrio sp. PSBB006 TaxID=1987723 RepID=UPI000B3B1043|nr:hypothetical protein [Cellvibrio sp. PSBB006]ARU29454.1 hypothetical protein CBR65_19535 [Cellvibrio sp. PSBB006]